jgi:signal transduction histidine kinase
MSKIFLSLITLKFANPDIEKQYINTLTNRLKTKNIIYCLIIILLLIVFNILYWIQTTDEAVYYAFKIISLCHSGIMIVLLILTISFPKNIQMQKIIIYLTFYLLLPVEVSVRYYFTFVLNSDLIIICMIYLIQYLFILTFYFTKMIDFMDGALLLLAKAITYYALYSSFFPLNIHFRFGVNNILLIFICSVSYFYVYEHRKSFYYYKIAETSRLWYQNVLENMNSGFISICESNVSYINKSLMNFLDLIKDDVIDEFNENNNELILSTRMFTNEAFQRDFIFSVIDEMFKNIKNDNFQEAMNVEVIKKYLKANSKETFINLGTCPLVGSKINSIQFEIHGRYYISDSLGGIKENFDFIFNDITRIKMTEQINAEFKYKSMFLSKVAHEFKNPILFITELTEQVKENLEMLKASNNESKEVIGKTNDILTSIKSMSDYLLILIKDMDYFSIKTNTEKKFKIDNDVIDVHSFLNFITNVTNILIKKFHKQDNLKFLIKQNNLPKLISSDEIKLKQILINLLSNAVKYTLHGNITLDISYNDNQLFISVEDTGRGISEEKIQNLYKPFSEQNKEFNFIGAGLGLSIVKDLVTLFGSQIYYEPNSPEGSIFKFSINLEPTNDFADSAGTLNPQNIIMQLDLAKSEVKTIEIEYFPAIGIDNFDLPGQLSDSFEDFREINQTDAKIILVVDDEVVTRKSTVRFVKNYCISKGINVRVMEAADGVECLWLYYQSLNKGERITLILSDETMVFMNGLYSANVLHELCNLRGFTRIPFYIVTAYESLEQGVFVNGVFSKPLNKRNLENALINSGLLDKEKII